MDGRLVPPVSQAYRKQQPIRLLDTILSGSIKGNPMGRVGSQLGNSRSGEIPADFFLQMKFRLWISGIRRLSRIRVDPTSIGQELIEIVFFCFLQIAIFQVHGCCPPKWHVTLASLTKHQPMFKWGEGGLKDNPALATETRKMQPYTGC